MEKIELDYDKIRKHNEAIDAKKDRLKTLEDKVKFIMGNSYTAFSIKDDCSCIPVSKSLIK